MATRSYEPATRLAAVDYEPRANQEPAQNTGKSVSKTITTTTTVLETTTRKLDTDASSTNPRVHVGRQQQQGATSLARVEDLGKQATSISARNLNGSSSGLRRPPIQQQQQTSDQTTRSLTHGKQTTTNGKRDERVEGNGQVTTISTIAAQSGQSRIVLALLKDGNKLQFKVQEMKPEVFELGTDLAQCLRYLDEHEKLVRNLRRYERAPLECWMEKYKRICQTEELKMSVERKLVYMCMAENLQSCWKALLNQLDDRWLLLRETRDFYQFAEQLAQSLDRADKLVSDFKHQFIEGPSSNSHAPNFDQLANEISKINELCLNRYLMAIGKQRKVIELIDSIGMSNLGDCRAGYLTAEAQNAADYISGYLNPLERRRIQLESVLSQIRTMTTTTKITTTNENINSSDSFTRRQSNEPKRNNNNTAEPINATKTKATNQLTANNSNGFQYKQPTSYQQYNNIRYDKTPLSPATTTTNTNTTKTTTGMIREISNFNDLNMAENWLNTKIDQLNSSSLSSLGIGIMDSRTILGKQEQIALECRTIEEATLTFNGKSIHAIKTTLDGGGSDPQIGGPEENRLFEHQKLLAQKVRDVITILDARIVLLRRTIDFYQRAREATDDVSKMMRRLQVDGNSLQSVQFVSNELELKDVSSVVASGATIISELQQLQLAQQHGHRSRIVNLNLVTQGIRSTIDQLNQDLAHLKTVLNQRRLVLMNEDAAKKASSFTNKCRQLHLWLRNQVRSYLLANGRIGIEFQQARAFCEAHEQLRMAVQGKTMEVEALLRSLPSLSDSFDVGKSNAADEVQRATDALRRDWIETTSCLDRRSELARKYLAALTTVQVLQRELESLDSFISGDQLPATSERTDEDIRANIDQNLVQLANQVRNFTLEAQRGGTELETHEGPGSGTKVDLNKQELIDHANSLLGGFAADRKRRAAEPQQREAATKSREPPPPASQRPQQQLPPRFTRVLADQQVEPFSTVELECETDSPDCQVDWLMNSFKRIPPAIRHQTSSEKQLHRLTISNFSPICCGTYLARASNSAGQTTTQCRLRLLGIREDHDSEHQVNTETSTNTEAATTEGTTTSTTTTTTITTMTKTADNELTSGQRQPTSNFHNNNSNQLLGSAVSPAVSATSSFSQWRPTKQRNAAAGSGGEPQVSSSIDTNSNQQEVANSMSQKGMSRIIQGVEQQQEGASASPTTGKWQPTGSNQLQFPVTRATYSGPAGGASGPLEVPSGAGASHYTVESPVSSATLPTPSRSASKSPFEGSPQAPVFVHGLEDSMARCCSRAGLVCLVVGNPPPTIEWMHNNRTIATTRCPKSRPPVRGSICKLTIETMNPRTQGQYVCRASNRVGQTSTELTLAK